MAMDPAHCNAFGNGIVGTTVNTMAPVTIQARDGAGNPILVGGDIFLVKVNGVIYHNTDNGDGTYSAPYFVLTPGNYIVDISSAGTQINNSPFTVTFT